MFAYTTAVMVKHNSKVCVSTSVAVVILVPTFNPYFLSNNTIILILQIGEPKTNLSPFMHRK